jgi:hypothetical protein
MESQLRHKEREMPSVAPLDLWTCTGDSPCLFRERIVRSRFMADGHNGRLTRNP